MLGQTNKKIRSAKLPQGLRNDMTDAEQALWCALRGRQISGLKFRRQHPFGDFILDFVCLEKKLVIEVDGGQYQEQAGDDEVRTFQLQKAGFHILRFWNNEVLHELEAVMEKIWAVVQELQTHPPPGLPLEGGGVSSPLRLKGRFSSIPPRGVLNRALEGEGGNTGSASLSASIARQAP